MAEHTEKRMQADPAEPEIRELITEIRKVAGRLPSAHDAIAVTLEEAADQVDQLLAKGGEPEAPPR